MSGTLGRIRDAARLLLLCTARNHTAAARQRSVLVVAPHPDDETLGCGGRILIARRAGRAVTVVVATDGAASHGADLDELRAVRRRELADACAVLGVEDLIALDHPDGELADYVDELASQLARLIDDRRPDEVYATCVAEAHPDHAAAGRALQLALTRSRHQPRAFEYPIWLWGDWPVSRRWLKAGPLAWLRLLSSRRSYAVRLDDVRADKVAAIDVYRSQLGSEVGGVAVGLPDQLLQRAETGPELYFDVTPKLR